MMLAESTSSGTTELIAVYAAVVATIVLLWDIYKHILSGPRIRLEVTANMRIYGDPRVSEDDLFIDATATNVGNLPTTIRVLGFRHYKSWRQRIVGRSDCQAAIVRTVLQPLPHILEPGKVWTDLIQQSPKVERLAND